MQTFLTFSLLLLWQDSRKELEETSNLSFYLAIVITAILSFIFGAFLTTVYFVSTRPKASKESFSGQIVESSNNQRKPIKQCPKCHSTYTDDELNYCLRDGLTLKVVGTMPIPPDPDKTIELKN